MKIILAAGGSGGHIFPSIALAEELEKKGVEEICCVASSRRLDKNILKNTPYRCFFLSANPMPRKMNPWRILVFLFKFLYDAGYSVAVLLKVRPAAVVGFGGYSSGAITFMAKLFGIPVVIHEQNYVPGRANRILSKMADKVAVSFHGSEDFFEENKSKVVYTGNPLRLGILSNDRKKSAEALGVSADMFTVLVMGGSQGSSFLNSTVSEVAKRINAEKKSAVQFIHLTGSADYDKVSEFYLDNGIPGKVFSFLDRIDDAYAASDIAISRSGAAAVFELAYYAKPMILIPYPNPKNNQRTNAKVFSDAGAAIYKEEKEMTADDLYNDMVSLIDNSGKRMALAEAAGALKAGAAGSRLAEVVIELVTSN